MVVVVVEVRRGSTASVRSKAPTRSESWTCALMFMVIMMVRLKLSERTERNRSWMSCSLGGGFIPVETVRASFMLTEQRGRMSLSWKTMFSGREGEVE